MHVIPGGLGSVELAEFLSRSLFAFLGTDSPDGPRVSPVWFLWEDEALWVIGDRANDSFPRRVSAAPRTALSIVDFDASTGLVHHVGMRGRAEVCEFDEARGRRLLRRYLGTDETSWETGRFGPPVGGPDSVLIRFTPETVVSRNQSYRLGYDAPRAGA